MLHSLNFDRLAEVREQRGDLGLCTGVEPGARYAEDAKNFYILGMDHDLAKALANSIKETVKFLGKQYGMSPRDAYSLCSTIIDFGVAEAVDVNLAMYGTVPKAYFTKKSPYWRTA